MLPNQKMTISVDGHAVTISPIPTPRGPGYMYEWVASDLRVQMRVIAPGTAANMAQLTETIETEMQVHETSLRCQFGISALDDEGYICAA